MHGKPLDHVPQACVGPDTVILGGKHVSLFSDAGVLVLLHGALQSSIAAVDDASNAEEAYEAAMLGLGAQQ